MKNYFAVYFNASAISVFELANFLNKTSRENNAKLVAVDNGFYIFEREVKTLVINKTTGDK